MSKNNVIELIGRQNIRDELTDFVRELVRDFSGNPRLAHALSGASSTKSDFSWQNKLNEYSQKSA